MTHSQFNGKRIAIKLDVQGQEVVLRGVTRTLRDPQRGTTLQVAISGEPATGQPIFYVTESMWREQIANGQAFECDYCLDLTREAVEV